MLVFFKVNIKHEIEISYFDVKKETKYSSLSRTWSPGSSKNSDRGGTSDDDH